MFYAEARRLLVVPKEAHVGSGVCVWACHSHGRPRLTCQLLASARPSPGYHSDLQNELLDGTCVCFFLSNKL